ncbi:MAG TPA: glycosyltransferase [Gemmatimonadales bacterium]
MSQASPRVIHVLAPAAYGGAEAVVETLVRQQGARAAVATLLQTPGPHPFVAALRNAGVDVHEIRCGRRQYRREARALASLMTAQGADVVHSHVYHADLVGYAAARIAALPIVSTVHGFTGGGLKNRIYEWLDLRALARMQAVIAVSGSVRDRVIRAGCAPERVHLIPNAVGGLPPADRSAARRALGLNLAASVVGWVGRLSREKGPDLFVGALESLGPRVPNAVLIGDGDEAIGLAGRIDSAGLGGVVRLAGAVPNAGRLLPAFDVLVLSSRTEGTPIILLEAMAARVPVVAFAVGGIPDVLDDGSAWLVAPDDVAALGRAVRAVLDDPDEARRRTAAAARILRTRFDAGDWVTRVDAVYQEVVGQ